MKTAKSTTAGQNKTAGEKRIARKNNGPRADEAAERSVSAEECRRILKARAMVLAREPVQEGSEAERIEIVEFLLASERYGIESSYIREVYPLKNLTPLPCTPPFVLGIMNVRGRILSVIDLGRFFELPNTGLSDLNKVLILSDGTMEFGILADVIVAARPVPVSALLPSLPTLTDIRADYLKGVTEERLVVLDGARILADPKIIVHEEV